MKMISNSNFKFNATSRANFYIEEALRMVKLFKTNGNTPLTCKETAEIIGRTHQRVSAIASHCDLFKVEKKKVDELFTCIKAVIPTEILRQDNGKYSVIVGCWCAYRDIEKIDMDGKYALLYKTVPIYKTYISLFNENINLT
jgi:hypothetical protein